MVRGVGKGVIAVPLAGVARKGTKAEVASLLRNLDLAKYIGTFSKEEVVS